MKVQLTYQEATHDVMPLLQYLLAQTRRCLSILLFGLASTDEADGPEWSPLDVGPAPDWSGEQGQVPGRDLVECFELARDVRELDMRAAPYDLSALGYEPVRIETADGKQQYIEAQRGFAERAAPLRAQLIEVCEALI